MSVWAVASLALARGLRGLLLLWTGERISAATGKGRSDGEQGNKEKRAGKRSQVFHGVSVFYVGSCVEIGGLEVVSVWTMWSLALARGLRGLFLLWTGKRISAATGKGRSDGEQGNEEKRAD